MSALLKAAVPMIFLPLVTNKLTTLLAPRGIWGELVHRTGWAVAPVGYVVRSPLPAAASR